MAFTYETEEITPLHREECRSFMENEWCGNKTCAILPIYSMQIAENMSSHVIAPVMIAAIPISAEVVSGAVFSAVGGNRL